MTKLTTGVALVAALLTGGLVAAPVFASKAAAELPGVFKLVDEAKLFSDDAVRQAEKKMSDAKFDRGLHFHVDTYREIPADRKAGYDPARKAQFFKDWAKSVATGDKAKGPYVLICMNPGFTEVVVDEESLNRGFTTSDAGEVQRIFDSALKESARKSPEEQRTIRDKALLDATDYVVKDLTGSKVVGTDGRAVSETGAKGTPAKKGEWSVGNWVCLGVCVLLGVWLVIGLIRAFTGGGGGYGPGGYGGGGGGFGSSLLGGLFGAMAGMWLYNSMFGSSGMFGGGSDAYASDGSTGNADTGAGDYGDGTSAGGGGDYGGGDTGGDYGGGDYGGGGDFGGGDFGGGGDF